MSAIATIRVSITFESKKLPTVFYLDNFYLLWTWIIVLYFIFGSEGLPFLKGAIFFLAGAQTAWDMLSEEQTLKHVSTSCEDLDTILGGGIHCKEVTEIGKHLHLKTDFSSV